jgi:hypothetical protein
MTTELTYEVKKNIVDAALAALHQGKEMKAPKHWAFLKQDLKNFIANKKQIEDTVSSSKIGGTVIRQNLNKSKTKIYKLSCLRTLVLNKLSALPPHSSRKTQKIFARTAAFQGKNWLLANPEQVSDKAKLQRLPSFLGSTTRTWTEGVLKQFQHACQPVLAKPPRRPKGMDPLFYIEGSEVKRIHFSDYMSMNQIKKVVPKAIMAFY